MKERSTEEWTVGQTWPDIELIRKKEQTSLKLKYEDFQALPMGLFHHIRKALCDITPMNLLNAHIYYVI
jgi:hypothetical protein